MNGIPRPPGTLRQIRLVMGLGVRRWVNLLAGGIAARKAARADGSALPRPPTARRRVGIGLFMGVVALVMLVQVGFMVHLFSERAYSAADHRPLVAQKTWDGVVAVASEAGEGWRDKVSTLLDSDNRLRGLSPAERAVVVQVGIRRLDDERLTHGRLRSQAEIRADPAIRAAVARMFALVLMTTALSAVIMSLGMGNLDLAKPEWSELWLAAQPVASRTIFIARLLQHALLNPLVWIIVPVMTGVMAWSWGLGWGAALALALLCGLAWAIVVAALRLLAETWLRQRLAHARIKNMQALCTVLGMAFLVVFYAVLFRIDALPAWFISLSEAPLWTLVPTGWTAVAALARDPVALAGWMAAGLGLALVVAIAGVAICSTWSRGGLIVHDGTYSGTRGARSGGWRPWSVLGKDLTLLGRDRAMLVQIFVMPVLVLAMQFAVNPQLLASVSGDLRAAATFAGVFGAWVLIGAVTALAIEGQALWILACAPQSLQRVIRGKVLMWMAFAGGYAALALIALVIFLPWPGLTALGDLAMIAAGVPILALLAVGIGAAATDPNATVPNRRVGHGAVYLYMLVMGLYALALNQGGAHQRLAMLVLLAVIAWALWQRLRDRLPWLFEPVEHPPRQVDLADGAWAAFAFLVLQGLLAFALMAGGLAVESAVVLAFGLAGVLVAGFTLFSLWRAHVPDLLRAVGVLPSVGFSLPRSLVTGVIAGLIAALLAAGYLAGIEALAQILPGLADSLAQAQGQHAAVSGWRLFVLIVVLAPLCEEFIFRGLLFRGFRRDLSPWRAAAASAAVFAIIHPGIGVVPVFGLGLACAMAFHRTGWLLAPVVAHALYNGAVMLLSGT